MVMVQTRKNDRGRVFTLAAEITGLTGENPESRTTWIHVAMPGEWHGHSSGPFSLGEDEFRSIESWVNSRQTPISVDYEHASVDPTGDPTPAAGWVKSVEVRPTGLWALIEFTKRAANYIREAEYKFCSGVFKFDAEDQVTGNPWTCILDSIALTNRPFLDGLESIALTRRIELKDQKKMPAEGIVDFAKLQRLVKAIDPEGQGVSPALLKQLIDTVAPDAVVAKEEPKVEDKPVEASASKAGVKKLTAAPPQEPVSVAMTPPPVTPVPMADPPVEAMDADMDPAMDAISEKLKEATGLDDAGLAAAIEKNMDEIVAILMGIEEAAEAQDGMTSLSRGKASKVMQTTINVMAAELQRLRAEEAKRNEVALSASVDELVRAGKIHPSQKAEYISLSREAPKTFKKLTASLPVAFPVGAHASAIAEATPAGENLTQTIGEVLPVSHPKVVALNAMFDGMQIPSDSPVRKEAVARLTGIKA